MSLYDKALAIAVKAHKGQVDKAGVDYIKHPLHVASLVTTEQEKAVALLHDVIEDSNISANDLRGFELPETVIEAVESLTKKKGEDYLSYLRRAKANPIARKVKLADLRHNSDLTRLSKITEKDKKRQVKYSKAIEFLG